MLSSTAMPVLMPRSSSSLFQQAPMSLSMYHPAILFQPTPLYPALAPPAGRSLLPHPWRSTLDVESPSPPVQMAKPLAIGPRCRPLPVSDMCGTPSPPCSPDSASSTERTAFTIDAILSSKKRSPSSLSSVSGSPRAGSISDRGSTPSPDSFTYNTTMSSTVRADMTVSDEKLVEAITTGKSSDVKSSRKSTIHSAGERLTSSSSFGMAKIFDHAPEKILKRAHSDDGAWSAGNSRAKRVRTIFTQEQLERLEREFGRQQYMVGTERLYLAAELNLSESQVKVWFQNRRIKWRKQNFEQQQTKLAEFRAGHEARIFEGSDDEGDDAEKLVDSPPLPASRMHLAAVKPRSPLDDTVTTRSESPAERLVEERSPERQVVEAPLPSAVSSSATLPSSLEQEVKKVEQRLAMRLCRRSMLQSSLTSSTSLGAAHLKSSAGALQLRATSTVRRFDLAREGGDYLSSSGAKRH
ncbi:uncharacterized protein [Diadema antillarum]|uniref:uncharacterized protein n=1 Tax=Diadema antillarum TaxID=105358 RepID=UPI003A887007